MCVAVLPTVLPLAWRWRSSSEATASSDEAFHAALGGNSKVVTYTIIVAAATTWLFFGVGVCFLSVGVAHLYRMYLVLDWITQLARPIAATHPNLPHLQLTGHVTTTNAKTILICLSVVLKFGERYKRRIECYAGFALGMAMVGLACVLVRVVLESPDEDGVADGRVTPGLDPFTCVILYIIVVVTGVAFRMISLGDASNSCVSLLASHITFARWRGLMVDEEAAAKSDALLSLAAERLSWLAETEPVTIAGLRATMDLGYSLLSVVGTAVAFILGKMLKLSLPA